ncbi:MAG: ABC transporter ATP-binding protein [Burkholderiales bacterium]|nr:ABC transporter ATP-binding protein [Burkholderiales bacterium]
MSAALVVENLSTHFFTKAGVVKAVNEVSFTVPKGGIVGLVGESGSGKSMTGYSIMGLIDPPGRVVGGRIVLGDTDLSTLDAEGMRRLRGRRVAMIFQDPMMTLNPVLRIDTQMIEAILAHEDVSRAAAFERAREALAKVGIASPDERLLSYPHQFSGGMRQRVAIATALLNRPELIIADEPTTALDVTIQGQILYEMQKLARDSGTALIWITHDLSVIAGLADRVCVMYAGRVVEDGTVDEVMDRPRHPYTRGLIGSVPAVNPRGRPLTQIPGMTPSLLAIPPGCAFRERCARADLACAGEPAMLPAAGTSGHAARCHHPHEEPMVFAQ